MMELFSIDPLVALRVISGVWFLPHCIGKIRNIERASETFARAGLKPGRAFVVFTIVAELLAGLGLVLGLYPQFAAALAVVVLIGAAYAVIKINGFNWRWQKQGPEYMLFWAMACTLSVQG
jgi:putative oxidoreductase